MTLLDPDGELPLGVIENYLEGKYREDLRAIQVIEAVLSHSRISQERLLREQSLRYGLPYTDPVYLMRKTENQLEIIARFPDGFEMVEHAYSLPTEVTRTAQKLLNQFFQLGEHQLIVLIKTHFSDSENLIHLQLHRYSGSKTFRHIKEIMQEPQITGVTVSLYEADSSEKLHAISLQGNARDVFKIPRQERKRYVLYLEGEWQEIHFKRILLLHLEI